jgi:hypothetical protein
MGVCGYGGTLAHRSAENTAPPRLDSYNAYVPAMVSDTGWRSSCAVKHRERRSSGGDPPELANTTVFGGDARAGSTRSYLCPAAGPQSECPSTDRLSWSNTGRRELAFGLPDAVRPLDARARGVVAFAKALYHLAIRPLTLVSVAW